MLLRANLLFGTALITLVAGACQGPAKRLNAPPQGVSNQPHPLQADMTYMTDNAMLYDMCVVDIHFVPHTDEISSLGARRSVKKQWQAAWLLNAVGCIDLTTLSGDDTPDRVRRLCAKALRPVSPEILEGLGVPANAIRVGRERGLNTSKWEDFLMRTSDFHSGRILAEEWNPISTNEAFFIAPLVQASSLFSKGKYLDAAIKAAGVYSGRHLSMREPYWGGTLDASCEDKEGAWAALEGFLALYDHTSERKYLDWARHAADVALTYLVVWDIDLPAGRLRNHGFKTRGWTAVSVQNQHIDVYGVLIAPSIYRLGQITQNQDLQDLAILMFRSCGQLIDPNGSQGEQPHHTNYAQHGAFRKQLDAQDISGVRGNYVESWTVFWITAHFLNAAAQFQELGVPIWQ